MPALHRADDRRSAERAAEVDDRLDEVAGLAALRGVGQREVQLVRHPTGAGADGRERQMMVDEQLLQRLRIDGIGRRREQLDRVEAQLGRRAARRAASRPKKQTARRGLRSTRLMVTADCMMEEVDRGQEAGVRTTGN